MRQDQGLLGTHEEIRKGLFDSQDKAVIVVSKDFQVGRVFDGLLSGLFDAQSFGETSIALPLLTFGNALELDGLFGVWVRGTRTARSPLLEMPTWTRLQHRRRARFVFRARRRRVTQFEMRMFAELFRLATHLMTLFVFARGVTALFATVKPTIEQAAADLTASDFFLRASDVFHGRVFATGAGFRGEVGTCGAVVVLVADVRCFRVSAGWRRQ